MRPELIPVTYSPALILLSFLVSAIGAYTALSAAAATRRGGRRLDRFNIFLSGLALGGIAIWSMHFVGMLAWKVDLGVGYRLLETLVSLLAAVLVSAIALGYVASGPMTPRRLLVAGPLAGIGVAVMHYMGMYSMRFSGFFEWDLAIVALSVLIAMAAATAALWLAFNTHKRSHRVGAALVMALAVCTMHYTGMAAAAVVCTSREPNKLLADLMRPADLPGMVVIVAFGIALMIALDLMMQRVTTAAAVARQRAR